MRQLADFSSIDSSGSFEILVHVNPQNLPLMISVGCVQGGACLSSDLENSKACSQASCRRVANHCSNLLDAVLIFKTWFIQRQSDLPSTNPETDIKSNGDVSILPYNNITNGQQPVLLNQINQHSSYVERDWVMMHAKRTESQLDRLRNSVVGMRAQLQAGLRHKLECEQLRRDLEMHKDTITHYQNIINEGNRLRDDLREELLRVRKEAAIARSRLASATTQRPVNSPVTSTPHAPNHHHPFDEADKMATTMMVMTDHAELSQLHDLPPQDAIIQLRTQIEYRIRLSESLKSEVKSLRETIRGMLEKEVAQSHIIDSIRTEFKTLIEPFWRLLQKNYDLNQMRSLNAVLNIHCITRIAKLLTIPIPDHVTMELSQFTDCDPVVSDNKSQKLDKKASKSVNSSTVAKSPKKDFNKSNENIHLINSRAKPSIDQKAFEMDKSSNKTSTVKRDKPSINSDKVDLDEFGQDEIIKNDPPCEIDKVELMSDYSSSESSRCGSLKFPDISSSSSDHDDDGDGTFNNNDKNKSSNTNNNDNDNNNGNYNNDKASPESSEDIFQDQNVIIQSPLHQSNITTNESNGLKGNSINISSLSCNETSNNSFHSPVVLNDVQPDENTVSGLQSRHVKSDSKSLKQDLIISEVSSGGNVTEKNKGENEMTNCSNAKTLNSSSISKSSEKSHKMVTRSRLKTNSQVIDSSLNTSSFHSNDNFPINLCEKSSDSKAKLILEETSYLETSTKPLVQQIKKLENKRSKTNVTLDDNVSSRVLTCPSTLSRSSNCPALSLSASLKSDVQLFSLLSDKYSSDILRWCDRLSSSSFLNEIPKICSSGQISSTSTNSKTHLQVPVVTVEAPQTHSSPIKNKQLCKLNDDEKINRKRKVTSESPGGKKMVLDCLSTDVSLPKTANHMITDNTKPDHQYDEIQQKCINFLLSDKDSIKTAPTDLSNKLKQTNMPIQIILSSLNAILTSFNYLNCPLLLKSMDEKFVSLYHSVSVDHQMEMLHCYQQSTEWLLNTCDKFTEITQYSIACGVIFKLLSTNLDLVQVEWSRQFLIQYLSHLFHQAFTQQNFALYLMPHIIDNCLIAFPNLWCNVELIKDEIEFHSLTPAVVDNNDHFSFSYITTTLKTLLAWQEAREARNACLKSNVQSNSNQVAVYRRLRQKGWLPAKASESSTPIEIHNFAFSQQAHRIRCLCLRLVDTCLNVCRDHITDDSSTHMTILSKTVVDLDIIYSLRLILSAMAFVVGEEAMIGFHDEQPANVSSRSRNHQRTRRYRQVERHRQHGLFGWLLTGRLLPWLTKCLKMKDLSSNNDILSLISRLSCLITDIIIYGSHLFKTNNPGKQCNSLKQLIFDAGNQLLNILNHNKSKEIMNNQLLFTYITCSIRLIAFNPKLIIQFIGKLPLEIIVKFIEQINHNELFSYLWPSSSLSSSSSSSLSTISSITHSYSLKDLIEQSISLVNNCNNNDSELSAELLQQYTQTCQIILTKLSL
ncbi:unnamed protein product [Schistosoma rodhaini]|nr:unnamed protein product [Schistosoma rodhaini]